MTTKARSCRWCRSTPRAPDHPATLLREPDDSSGLPAQRLRYVDQPNARRGRRAGGPGAIWRDARRHDRLLVLREPPQWALWTFFADQHETAPALAGSCSTTSDPTIVRAALFYNSFISDRRRSAIRIRPHHCQEPFLDRGARDGPLVQPRALVAEVARCSVRGSPWIPLMDEPEARSFMNYPYGVLGEAAFYADFDTVHRPGTPLHAPR